MISSLLIKCRTLHPGADFNAKPTLLKSVKNLENYVLRVKIVLSHVCGFTFSKENVHCNLTAMMLRYRGWDETNNIIGR